MSTAPDPSRDAPLDFVKGALVVLMVFYHWVSYIAGQQLIDYRYVRFITPSFVLITGFVVSHIYLKKFSYDSPALARRLIQRGLKLIGLFLVLNLAAVASEVRGDIPWSYWRDWITSVVVFGQGRAAFTILLSIGYFLIFTPVALMAAARLRVPLTVTAILVVALCWGASLLGRVNLHGEFLAMGMIGLAAGAYRDSQRVAATVRPLILVLLYALYIAAVVAWNVVFPVQVIAACISVLILYRFGVVLSERNYLRWILTLGRYSLFAYIGQILILRLLRMAAPGPGHAPAMLALTFVVALAATVASVEFAEWLRGRVSVADRLYRTVFA